MLPEGDGAVVVRTDAGDWRGFGAAMMIVVFDGSILMMFAKEGFGVVRGWQSEKRDGFNLKETPAFKSRDRLKTNRF